LAAAAGTASAVFFFPHQGAAAKEAAWEDSLWCGAKCLKASCAPCGFIPCIHPAAPGLCCALPASCCDHHGAACASACFGLPNGEASRAWCRAACHLAAAAGAASYHHGAPAGFCCLAWVDGAAAPCCALHGAAFSSCCSMAIASSSCSAGAKDSWAKLDAAEGTLFFGAKFFQAACASCFFAAKRSFICFHKGCHAFFFSSTACFHLAAAAGTASAVFFFPHQGAAAKEAAWEDSLWCGAKCLKASCAPCGFIPCIHPAAPGLCCALPASCCDHHGAACASACFGLPNGEASRAWCRAACHLDAAAGAASCDHHGAAAGFCCLDAAAGAAACDHHGAAAGPLAWADGAASPCCCAHGCCCSMAATSSSCGASHDAWRPSWHVAARAVKAPASNSHGRMTTAMALNLQRSAEERNGSGSFRYCTLN